MKIFAVLRRREDGRYGLLNLVPVHGSDEAKISAAHSSAQRLAQGWRNSMLDADIVVSLRDDLNGCQPVNNYDGFTDRVSLHSPL